MKQLRFLKLALALILAMFSYTPAQSQIPLWVGQSYTADFTSAVIGITYNIQWSTSGGYISLDGSGFYRTITVTKYFSGTATVTCEWDYKLTSSSQMQHIRRSVSISCRENKIYVHPTSMTLAVGESSIVGYSYQYQNQYTSYDKPYFQSSSSAAVVDLYTGKVTAKKPGKTLINVYSDLSSPTESPYCIVNVTKGSPLNVSASIPSGIVNKGTEVALSCSEGNATIRYTTDGSTPTASSTIYTRPIKLTESTALKARAYHTDYADGNVLTESYTVTSLSIVSQYPGNDYDAYRKFVLPSLTFSDNIKLRKPNSVTLVNSIGDAVPGEAGSGGNSVWFTPSNSLSAGTYTLTIQQSAIQSESGPNAKITHTFTIKAKRSNATVTKVAAGWQFSMALLSDGSLWTWGAGTYGKLGNGSTDHCYSPRKVLNDVVDISAGSHHAFAIRRDGSLWGWGFNNKGEVGDGTSTIRTNPVKIKNKGITAISAGSYFSLAVYNFENIESSLWSWGVNNNGQLGNGTSANCYTPKPINNYDVIAVSAGGSHSMELKNDGSLWVFGGNNYGQLGIGYRTYTPKKLMDGVSSIEAGYDHSLAIKKDGSLWAWGSNEYGQVGNSSSSNCTTPTKIMDNAKVVSAFYNTFVIKKDGSLWGWGYNRFGQLGNGTKNNLNSPLLLQNDVDDVAAGYDHTLFLKDGAVWACGNNDYGQLGNGTTTNAITPILILDNKEKWITNAEAESPSLKVPQESSRIISLKLTPRDGSYESISWESLKPAIASVNQYGIVTGKEIGSTIVKCSLSAGGNTFSFNIPVTIVDKNNSVEKISIDFNSNAIISIYTMGGETLYNGPANTLPTLPKGIYIIRQGSEVTKTLIK